jgi:sphinganine-1-phosphate aldolase
MKRFKKFVFRTVRRIPWVQRKIEQELNKNKVLILKDLNKVDKNFTFITDLPSIGMNDQNILQKASDYEKLGLYDYSGGKVSGTVYCGDSDLANLCTRVFNLYCWSNPLHPDVFPGCRKMEAEVVRMTCTLFNGDSKSCGTVTSGGTESILLACLAYRNLAYSKGIRYPEIIAPITVHAAFDKAAEMFRMKLTHIPIDINTMKVDVAAMNRAINSSTCLLVGSCPNFPHGIIDPIEDIAKLGRKYDIPVHVDACLGGFLVCFMDDAGYPLKPFDFQVPGVTSISADTHKYGYAVKGSSVLMFSKPELRHYQFFCQPDWPGGIYASPTLAGSRSGANIAVCWATLLHYGRKGYVDRTKKVIAAARYLAKNLQEIEGITVMGNPEVSVVAFTSYVFNIYSLCDRMTKLGWSLNALQFPSAIHFCVTANHIKEGVVEKFITDMRNVSANLIQNPDDSMQGKAAIYGSAQTIPDRSLIADMANTFLDACYSTEKPKDDFEEAKN